MLKIVISLLLTLPYVYAQGPTLNLDAFFEASETKQDIGDLGIAYHHMTPDFEDNPPEDKELVLEFYQGEFSDSPESRKQLEFVRSILDDDKKINNGLELEAFAFGPKSIKLEESRKIQSVLEFFETSPVQYEQIENEELTQAQLHTSSYKKEIKRLPSSIREKIFNPRVYWTVIRGTSSFGATFAGLYIAEGLSPGVASMVSMMPALASGGITYFNGSYGNFLTNGKWSNWLLESDSKFAKTLRKGFGLNEKSLSQHLLKNQKMFQKKYPNMYQRNISLFEKQALEIAKDTIASRPGRLKSLLSRLHSVEEYLKWYVTEVAFVGLAIKVPQSLAGIGGASSLLSATGDVLAGSAIGMIAQGPGDIAIQLRKFQKIEELKLKILAGEIENVSKELVFIENKKSITKTVTLLEEIDMVLAKTGKYASYSIRTESHRALNRIENWARSRATMLSFFSVAGVGMQLAGIPVAKPLLIAVGLGGGAYFAHVKGWTKISSIKAKIKKFKFPEINFRLSGVFNRFCQAKFLK